MDIHSEVDRVVAGVEQRPRDTRFWERDREVIMAELRSIEHDPRFRAALVALATLRLAANVVTTPLDDGSAALAGLVAYVTETAPNFSREYDVRYWCAGHVAAQASLMTGDLDGWATTLAVMSQRMRLYRIGEATIASDGAVTIPPSATDVDLRHVRDFQRSIEPAKSVGRPKQTPKPKGSGRPTISEQAQADAMVLGWPEWARIHALDLDMTDDKQRERARRRWRSARQRYELDHS